MYNVTQHVLKVPVHSFCRNISPAAGCLLQHQCLPGVFRARLYWTMSGHEVMWQLLLLSQVLKTADCAHVVDFLPRVQLFITHTLPTDTTNWSGVHMEWIPTVTHLGSLLQEARTAMSSCMILQRSWLERATWSLLRVTSTQGQWELSTSTHSKYDSFNLSICEFNIVCLHSV